VPYVYAGLLLYDLIAGKASLGRSRILGRKKALSLNPAINPKGLKAAVSYFDGAFNDSRMAIALLQSAQAAGAAVHNYHQVITLNKNKSKLSGVTVLDTLTGDKKEYRASVVVNATGPFVDTLRQMDDPLCKPMMQISSGIHIIVEQKFLPSPKGIMIPKTSDGRVLFVLPYQGKCMIGTSDTPATLSTHPKVTDTEIGYLLENVNRYFDIKVTRQDIQGQFSGLRPLLAQQESSDTAMLVREHLETFSKSGLLTIAGGKWTSYRSMAESVVNTALEKLGKSTRQFPCKTAHYPLLGSRYADRESFADLPTNLFARYGDRSPEIIKIMEQEDATQMLHPDLDICKAELLYTIRHEYVRKPLDFIMRRVNLGLIDTLRAQEILHPVTAILGQELRLSSDNVLRLKKEAQEILLTHKLNKEEKC